VAHQHQSEAGYLDSMPRGVTLREPISMARAIPGASLSITSLVAWELLHNLSYIISLAVKKINNLSQQFYDEKGAISFCNELLKYKEFLAHFYS